MYIFYQVAQWVSLAVLLATAVAAMCALRWSRRPVYIYFLLACLGFALAPSTPCASRIVKQRQMTEKERVREDAMMEEFMAVNEKYHPIPYSEVPYILNLPFGQVFLLLGVLYLANEERKGGKKVGANN
jgi:hypothetical protein